MYWLHSSMFLEHFIRFIMTFKQALIEEFWRPFSLHNCRNYLSS